MPQGYGGRITQEQADEINELLMRLSLIITDKRLRHLLAKLNKYLHDESGGLVTERVNWNS